MEKIEIRKEGVAFYYGSTDSHNKFLLDYSDKNCSICNVTLTKTYVSLIERLKKSRLLDKNYRPVCCLCYLLRDKIKKTKCECGRSLKLFPTLRHNLPVLVVICHNCHTKEYYDIVTYTRIE